MPNWLKAFEQGLHQTLILDGKNGQITQIKRVIKKKMTSRSLRQTRKSISIITAANPEGTPKPPIQLLEKSAKKPDAAGAGRVFCTN